MSASPTKSFVIVTHLPILLQYGPYNPPSTFTLFSKRLRMKKNTKIPLRYDYG